MIKLLVTTDFSTNSKAGIQFALQLQAQTKCELIFYHVVEIMKPTSWNDKRYKHFATEKTAEFREKLINFVNKQRKNVRAKGNITFSVEIGISIDDMVIHFAKKNKANFICLSTKGAGKITSFFGTNASSLVNKSPIPVLVIPNAYKVKKIVDIFYASDLAKLSSELTLVKKLANELNAKIKVFHYDYLIEVPENKNKLEKIATKYKNKDLSFNFRKLNIDIPLSEHLKNEINKEKPGLIILFTKPNLHWFNHLFPSGEARQMAFNTKIPLLVFRKKIKA